MQVLNTQPKGQEALYSFCADYLDKRLEERENSESDDKVGDGKLSPTKGKHKSGFLRREGTFNLYSTDSGIFFSWIWSQHEAILWLTSFENEENSKNILVCR